MGCDIHVKCEVKENGVWKLNPVRIFENEYFDNYREEREKGGKIPDYAQEEFLTNPPRHRNYDWFSILADVRNGRGFAGCKTGEGFEVIAEPRGIPEDATEEWKKECEDWYGDFHSHSWLTPEDFDKFDWSQKSIKTGIIPIEEYRELRGTNKMPPNGWSGGISGPDIVIISQEQADGILGGSLGEEGVMYYVEYYWSVLYSNWFNHCITDTVEPLKKLKEQFEEVRIVFAFDN